MNASEAGAELRALVGDAAVSTSAEDVAGRARDWSPRALLETRRGTKTTEALGVVRPVSTEQVALILRWAEESGCAVVPFGGGSGVCGGIQIPDDRPSIVLDTGELWRIVDLDEKSRLVRAQAGVSGPQLAAALEEHGWMTGHEPQSIGISTVGGWIATRAVGQLSARYGGIEDACAGLEAVLPGGRILRSKVVPRRSAGPDVAALMLGSEGTLGVVTEATLRIHRIPAAREDRCLRFQHMSDGVAACRILAQSDLAPTLVRLYDREDAAIFLRHHADEEPGPLLLLSFDGGDAAGRADAAVAAAPTATRGSEALVEHWWRHRNDAVDDFRTLMRGEGLLGPHGIVETMEVSGTWTVLRDLYHSMKSALQEAADVVGCHLSHIYPDGACLYFTMGSACGSDDDAAAALEGWWRTGLSACLAAGGSISHHHGIGRVKAPWLPQELGGWFEVLRAVKRAIDPKGIMNPGALGL